VEIVYIDASEFLVDFGLKGHEEKHSILRSMYTNKKRVDTRLHISL